MSLSINKRLKYFDTEEDYERFLEEQRASADAGTLELLETTVCCITHGNTETPDTYLPSHDVGDEDKLMHYNATDEIRYIPFINPMWTSRGVALIEDNYGGYKPVLYTNQTKALPDVIDGQQITSIDNDFLHQLYMSPIPDFSNANVKYLYFDCRRNTGSSYVSQEIPSEWPSLETLYIDYHNGLVPILKDGNILIAPELTSLTAYFVKDLFPIKAPLLSTCNFYIHRSNIITNLNLDNIITDSSSLTNMNFITESLSTTNWALENLNFTYSGNGLQIRRWPYFGYMDTNTGHDPININWSLICENRGTIYFNTDFYFTSCDFHGSTFDIDSSLVKFLSFRFVNCVSTSQDWETFMNGVIRHKSDCLEILKSIAQYYIFSSAFDNVLVKINQGIAQRYYVTLNYDSNTTIDIDENEPNGDTLQISGTKARHINLIYPSDYHFQEISFTGSSPLLSLSTSNNSIRAYHAGTITQDLSQLSLTNKIHLYCYTAPSSSSYQWSAFFNSFILHNNRLTIYANSEINNLELYLEPYYDGTTYYQKNSRTLYLYVDDEISNISVTNVLVDDETISNTFINLRLYFNTSTVSVATLQRVVAATAPLLETLKRRTDYPAILNVRTEIYSQLTTSYKEYLVSLFDQVNEIIT